MGLATFAARRAAGCHLDFGCPLRSLSAVAARQVLSPLGPGNRGQRGCPDSGTLPVAPVRSGNPGYSLCQTLHSRGRIRVEELSEMRQARQGVHRFQLDCRC